MVPFSGNSTSHWAKRVYAVFALSPSQERLTRVVLTEPQAVTGPRYLRSGSVPPFLSRRLSYGYAVNMRETRGARKTHHNLLLLSIIGSVYAIQDC